MTIRLKPTLLAAAIGLAGVTAAHAGTMITQWDYSVAGVWSSASFSSTSGNNGISADGSTIHWGVPSPSSGPQSSLTIDKSPVTGKVNTGTTGDPSTLDFAAALSLTHANNVITGGSLTSAKLTATLTLTPFQPVSGSAQTPPSIQYDIRFVETTNSWANCPVPTSPANNPCNDIFVQVTGAMNQTFDYDGYTYYLNILPLDDQKLSVLGNAACQAAGVANGCIGFTTEEGKKTTLPFGFTITTTPVTIDVPEPGMLALLGLGLGVAGFAGRRRKAA